MNNKNLIYIVSLILITASIFLIIEYPNSGRLNLIAGVTIMIGLIMNIGGFLLTKKVPQEIK
jgi:hypothetical protein